MRTCDKCNNPTNVEEGLCRNCQAELQGDFTRTAESKASKQVEVSTKPTTHHDTNQSSIDAINSNSLLGGIATFCSIGAILAGFLGVFALAQGGAGTIAFMACLWLCIQGIVFYALFKGFADHIVLQKHIAKTLEKVLVKGDQIDGTNNKST
jgi:hypothetical protein